MASVATTMDRAPPSFATDDARWQAVKRRDGTADGVFYYSVLTTGVYCRPSCASRLARRDNVAFHATCQAAEAADTYKDAAAATTLVGEKTVLRSKAARALMAAGKTSEARELWQQLADDPDAELVHAEARIRLGELGVQTAGGA